MFSALLAVLAGESEAQTTTPRVDPAYLAYLRVIEEIGAMDVDSSQPWEQLWPGMVALRDLDQHELGTVFTSGTLPTLKEIWFVDAAIDPAAGFELVSTGIIYTPGEEAEELDAGWNLRPCYVMHVKYTPLPDAGLASKLVHTANIDRHEFELEQGGVPVGRMLREHHQVPNMPEQFIDHWAFYTSYEFPKLVDDTVEVHPTGQPVGTVAAFFADVIAAEVDPSTDVWIYAQVQYKRLVGFQCVANLI